MFSKILLAVWSMAGFIWSILAWRLVVADQRNVDIVQALPMRRSLSETSTQAPCFLDCRPERSKAESKDPFSKEGQTKRILRKTQDDGSLEERISQKPLSVFKPLPPLGKQGINPMAIGLESFIAQLDEESELLLGIHEADRLATAPFLDQMQTAHPGATLKIIFRSEADETANPKIAWQKVLAQYARGELWLWSDADIVAPQGFLHFARLEYARRGATLLTFPYVIREISSPPALLDALFVNVEFYPGLLLLRKLGPVDFGLGAAMLFQRDDFLNRVDWQEIGKVLADDFYLGQKLKPVWIGTTTLTTGSEAADWRAALAHDLRWNKTIRWNRPIGSASRILILPVAGWFGYAALHPSHLLGWGGLIGMMQLEVLFALAICRRLGCHLKVRDLLGMELWTFWRIILWLLCWLPGPVIWRGQIWRGPKSNCEINRSRS